MGSGSGELGGECRMIDRCQRPIVLRLRNSGHRKSRVV